MTRDLDRMKKLAGINEWGDDEWDSQVEEMHGNQTVWLMRYQEPYEGAEVMGIYSSREKIEQAYELVKDSLGQYIRFDQMNLDDDPRRTY